jgi:hypothetical protein
MSRNFKYLTAAAAVSAGFSTINPIWAADYQSPRTAALGGAGHAGPIGTDGIYLNPSYVSLVPAYAVSTGYQMFNAGTVNPQGYSSTHGHDLNVSIQDGKTEQLQAGFGVTQSDEGRLFQVGVSKAAIPRLGVGVGAKFFIPSNPNYSFVREANVSASYAPMEWLQLSVLGDNLLESDGAKSQNLYRQFTVGSKINFQHSILVYADPHWTPNLPTGSTVGLEAGVEIVTFNDFFIRAGKYFSSYVPTTRTVGNGYGLGLGFLGGRTAIDYAFTSSSSSVPGTTHVFGVSLYL